MEKDKLKILVRGASFEEGGKMKLRCAAAFRLAGKHKAALPDIGRVCNQEGIRICRCQLGCFR